MFLKHIASFPSKVMSYISINAIYSTTCSTFVLFVGLLLHMYIASFCDECMYIVVHNNTTGTFESAFP